MSIKDTLFTLMTQYKALPHPKIVNTNAEIFYLILLLLLLLFLLLLLWYFYIFFDFINVFYLVVIVNVRDIVCIWLIICFFSIFHKDIYIIKT